MAAVQDINREARDCDAVKLSFAKEARAQCHWLSQQSREIVCHTEKVERMLTTTTTTTNNE
jgi:hypothetical protein